MLRTIIFSGLIFISWIAKGQIVDDSTELVYNPETTLILLEEDIKNNLEIERHPDTTLNQLEDFTWLDKTSDYYQDLGNSGTAMYPIFYPLDEVIGRKSGFDAYNIYMIDPERLRIYDTKSPFMDLKVVFGGGSRAVADFNYSRNVSENWNVGFDIYRITSDKQIGYAGQGDRNVVSTTFDLYSYYKHKTLPYSMIISLANMSHNVEETGGISVEEGAPLEDFFQYQDADIHLSGAQTYDKRIQGHLYHQYELTPQLGVYHQFDYKRQKAGFYDQSEGSADDPFDQYYDRFLIDPDSTYENAVFSETLNEAGLKGDLANIFYRVYIKSRILDMDYLYLDPTSGNVETYLGGYARFDWKEKFNIEAQAEFLQSGEYKLIGKINSDLIFGSYKSVLSKPGFLKQSYFGNNHEWYNNFQSEFTNEIKGGIQVKTRNIKLRPTGRIVSMNNFTYYDQEIRPRQAGSAAMFSVGGDVNLTLYTNREFKKAFHLENEVYYSETAGGDASKLRVPKLFYNGRVYWSGAIFKNTMGIQIGVNVHAKTSYYALAYAPEIQQFYLQDDFQIEAFYAVDAFLNVKVDKLRVFLKMTHANQPQDGGYFITPGYPGEGRMIGLGARWLFFD